MTQASREAIIDVKLLSKSFGDDVLFSGVSFKVFQGSFTTILGLNGIGKSSLLNILSCKISADKAEGTLLGEPLGIDLAEKRQSVALVSENLNYELGASAREFAFYYAQLYPTFDKEKFLHYVKERRLDLSKHFTQYSRGQKMQYCLILALSQNPKLLFIDEITSVLDYKAREFFLHELTLFCQNGGTVVLTTNIINEVQQCSTDLVIIKSVEEIIWGEQVEILSRFVKLRLSSLSMLTDEIREKALYLGKDSDHFHLVLIEREKIKDLPSQQDQNLTHPNLHEVFSYLTQAQ